VRHGEPSATSGQKHVDTEDVDRTTGFDAVGASAGLDRGTDPVVAVE
jgi:hypothetical protein